MLIIHGEHTVKSRDALAAQIQAAHAKQHEVVRLSAKELTPALLEETFVSNSLFGTPKTIIIEELHSLPKSAKKDALISQLAQLATASEAPPVVLWEKRQLTATMLKKFPGTTAEEFKLSSLLFKWMDAFTPTASKTQLLKDLQTIYHQDGAEFFFAMLCRQVRLLLSILDDGKVQMAPFMVSKIKKQAQQFSLEKLLKLHQSLLEIDVASKTSGSRLSLEQQLDLLVLSL